MIQIVKNTREIPKQSLLVLVTLGLMLLGGCGEKKAEEPEMHDAEQSQTEVALTHDQYKTVGIETGAIENRNLNAVIKANGYTAIPPQNAANVSALMSGVVKDIFVLEGTFVDKGKILATIQNLEVVEIREAYSSAMANIEYLQLEFNRQKTLSDENVNPRKTFQEVKSKLAVEKAKAQAAKSKLEALNVSAQGNSSIFPLVSPISGYVGKINISKGAFAETGIPLIEVADNSQMHLDLNVYEKDLGSIALDQEVDFVLTNQSNKVIKGKIFGINKSFSNESKTVAVHAKINPESAKGLISGMYVSANINVRNATLPALPKDAVVKNGDKYFVFVLDENHKGSEQHGEKGSHNEVHFKAMEVVPGTTDMGYTAVKFVETLPADAKMVTKGAFYLLSAMKGGSGHEH
jgi:cobalt-zinc-cadmium efflux system membrane fusion protein